MTASGSGGGTGPLAVMAGGGTGKDHPSTGISSLAILLASLAMPVDDTILTMCDVKGCHEPQSGEVLELELEGEPPCWVRVRPCASHRERMVRKIKR